MSKKAYRLLDQDEPVKDTDQYHHDGCWYELNEFQDHSDDEGKLVREFDDLIFRRELSSYEDA